ncbi:MAG: RidA family protein [Hyphomicrobiales bacterium]|nr:RidA family protein [Hyphomicrobiales bacterium]
MSIIAAKLKELGHSLPPPVSPIANYVPCVRSGNLLILSGQLAGGPDGLAPAYRGKLGAEVDLAAGQAAARQCVLNILALVQHELGDLDRVARCVQMRGFINTRPDYQQMPQVMNGASDLMVAVFGDAGRHARSTIGVAQLPLDSAVEIEAIFEVKP